MCFTGGSIVRQSSDVSKGGDVVDGIMIVEIPREGGKEVMDIMWPLSQSHFYVSCLCSLK